MSRVLVTGMSGVGKTTVLDVLSGRGAATVDTDYDAWVLPDGTWDESRMDQLLVDHRDIVVSGTVSNQGRFYDRFEHVVLLSAPVEVLLDGSPRGPTTRMGTSPTSGPRSSGTSAPSSRCSVAGRRSSLTLDDRRPTSSRDSWHSRRSRLCWPPVMDISRSHDQSGDS